MTGVYSIESPSNKIYIGQTHNFEQRKKTYKKLQCEDQPRLYNSLRKHGFENHTFKIVQPLPSDTDQTTLDYWEQFFIDSYREQGYELLNLKEGGSNGLIDEESRKKISQALSGKTHTKEHRVNQIRSRGFLPVHLYDSAGNYIRSFDFRKEVASYLNCHPDSVWKALKHRWLLFKKYIVVSSEEPIEKLNKENIPIFNHKWL